jgi:LysR family transcriptional regulator for bpeEF and oprC
MSSGFLEQLASFAAVARTESVTAAARQLGLPQPTVSRHLSALEQRMGAPLVHRSTRALTLTAQGEVLLQRALAALQAADDARDALSRPGTGTGFRGRLRVSCSHAFLHVVLMPALADWRRRHPAVDLEIHPSDELEPLVSKAIDVAIRVGTLPDSGLVARRIGTFARLLVASRSYLERHPAPAEPEQLATHQCIGLVGGARARPWTLVGPRGTVVVAPPAGLRLGTVDALRSAVLADLGIAQTPTWFWPSELADGRVVQILDGWQPEAQHVHAVSPVRHERSSRAGSFIDFVEQAFAARLPGRQADR